MLIVPPAPRALVLLSTWPPLTVMLPTFAVIVPALPAAVVAAETRPPSATVAFPPDQLISPAFPAFDAVLNRPVPVPEIEALGAASVIAPPAPPALVLLLMVALLAMLKVPTFKAMLPAAPPAEVATEMVPPSAMVSTGVLMITCPAFAFLELLVEEKMPLCGLALKGVLGTPVGDVPDIETEFAFTVTLPPRSEAWISALLETWPPRVSVSVPTFIDTSPPRAPSVLALT